LDPSYPFSRLLGVEVFRPTILVTMLDRCLLYVDVFRYYINYKLMKKKVKQYGQQLQQGEKDRRRVLKDFSKMLDDQVMLRNRNL